MDDDDFGNIGLEHTVGDHTLKICASPIGGTQYLHKQRVVHPGCYVFVTISEPTIGFPKMASVVGWHFP